MALRENSVGGGGGWPAGLGPRPSQSGQRGDSDRTCRPGPRVSARALLEVEDQLQSKVCENGNHRQAERLALESDLSH